MHSEVVEVMRELDIDVSGRVPRKLGRADAEWADVVVTMGCGDACSYVPGKRYIDWQLDDVAVTANRWSGCATRPRGHETDAGTPE